MRVRFVGSDSDGNEKDFGSIIWDGQRFAIDPPGAPIPTSALRTTVGVDGGARSLRANDDPELFMRSLDQEYSGSRVRAMPPQA